MTVGLPTDKVRALEEKLRQAADKKSICKRDLQSLAGSLAWASRVIVQGKYFVGNLFKHIKRLSKPWQHTRLDTALREDITWWIDHVEYLNHSRPIIQPWYQYPLVIDACTEGAGGFFNNEWFHFRWEDWPQVACKHINYKEVLTFEPAAHIYGPQWHGKRILVYSDSRAAVGMLNRGRSPDDQVNHALRRIYHLSVVHNFQFKAIYYPGIHNSLADRCSRLAQPGGWELLLKELDHTFVPYGSTVGEGGYSFQGTGLGA